MEVFKIIKIIGGIRKNFKLNINKNFKIRPTLGRIRENLFNILQKDIQNSIGLDLFAGTGAIGIEALSKGANKIFFVDNNKKIIKNIKENLYNAKFLNKSIIFNCSWLKFLKKNNEKFDWIFIDPPYNLFKYENIIKAININNSLKKKGFLIIETNKYKIINKKIGKYVCFKKYKYGNIILWFYKEIKE